MSESDRALQISKRCERNCNALTPYYYTEDSDALIHTMLLKLSGHTSEKLWNRALSEALQTLADRREKVLAQAKALTHDGRST